MTYRQLWYNLNADHLAHDVKDTDFLTQNGSAHGKVLTTFKRQYLTKQTINQRENCSLCSIPADLSDTAANLNSELFWWLQR